LLFFEIESRDIEQFSLGIITDGQFSDGDQKNIAAIELAVIKYYSKDFMSYLLPIIKKPRCKNTGTQIKALISSYFL